MMQFPPAVQVLRDFTNLPGQKADRDAPNEHFQQRDDFLRDKKVEWHVFD